ncbi:protein cortex-like isoform X2 [Cataglyphis hispanica]|uniref:protein cortex-like isoform X2 n=1 Tax=Cataglyphis hispanica TaxID=1086592 RepID=UPI00218081E8|nr:protein cortex-like isoform X2 [Cataglyphis hispanica]
MWCASFDQSHKREMNRLLDFGEQNQDIPNDTPLRGYHPRFRRTELMDITKSNIPRKWLLASTLQAALAENPEEHSRQNYSESLNDARRRVGARPSMPRQTYSGDRFIPCRRGYSFEAAHCLLRKESEDTEGSITIDVHKQLDLLHVTHQREACQAIMTEQAVIPGLNQTKILHYSNSTQSENPRRTGSKKVGNWRCTPRKRTLIGSIDKILCISDSTEGDNIDLVDWSCNDMIGVGSRNCVRVCSDDGTMLATWQDKDRPRVIKWSNDGSKLAVCTSFKIILYNLERKKSMWDASCRCLIATTHNYCVICCICWSSGDRHVVTGCLGSISVYASDTGKLISTNMKHMARISSLNFSPNFKYLVTTAQDKTVGVFIWPDLTPCYHIKFAKNIKAIAWHPQVSNTLCIGDGHDGSLSLWDINKKVMTANVCVKSHGLCVENFAWNKLSGELVVHWTYKVANKRYTIVPVLASFDRIVDALPLATKEAHISFLKFNATHEELITYGNEVFSIWKFFGNEKFQYGRQIPLYNSTRCRQGVLVHNPIR